MKVLVTRIDDVQNHPEADRLSLVTVGENVIVANKLDDGTPRWAVGDMVAYVPENAIIPFDVLKERGYWNDEKDRGLLAGSKNNRVKMQRFAGVESRGLIFRVDHEGVGKATSDDGNYTHEWDEVKRGVASRVVNLGDDVAEFFGVTEYVPQ